MATGGIALSARSLLFILSVLTSIVFDGPGIPDLALAGAPPESSSAAPQPAAQPDGNPSNGRKLFDGGVRFRAGGPPCAACHDAAGLPFPWGGSLGPTLAGASSKYGTQGLANVLSTLFFPTMAPIFDQRPLTGGEQRDLEGFFKSAAGKQAQPDFTGRFVLLAAVALLVLLVLAWLWKNRSCPPAVHASLLRMRRTGGVR